MHVRLFIAVFMAASLLSTPIFSSSTLSVRGHAVLSEPADQLHISVGVTTRGKNAKEALDENSTEMRQLISALDKAGLKDNEFQTGRFSIHPLYSLRPKNAPSDWTPEITGFQVRNTLNIVTEKIDQAGNLIDTAASAGANTIDNVQFQISNPQEYRNALINAATRNALEDALSLSEAANVKLIRITSLSVDDAQAVPRQPFMLKAMSAESAPIVAGDIEMSASVTVIYQID